MTFQSDRDGDFGLFTQRADGSRPAERLTKADEGTAHIPDDWSPDGSTLLFEMMDDRKSDRTLWTLSSGGKHQVEGPDFHGGAAAFIQATFSPNGRWFAYRSLVKDGTGVAVQPFPPTGSVFPISDPMLFPVWARDGKTLFFNRMSSGEFYAVPVTTEGTLTFGAPRRLPFAFPDRESNSAPRNHDVTPDGTFIGIVAQGETTARPQINVVLNWGEALARKIPSK